MVSDRSNMLNSNSPVAALGQAYDSWTTAIMLCRQRFFTNLYSDEREDVAGIFRCCREERW